MFGPQDAAYRILFKLLIEKKHSLIENIVYYNLEKYRSLNVALGCLWRQDTNLFFCHIVVFDCEGFCF